VIKICLSQAIKKKQKNIRNSQDKFLINVNNVQFEFVNIPPGEFYMGSNNCGDYSKPIHEVKIDYPFQMSKTEVTVAQFALFAEETGLVTVAEKQGHAGTVDHELWVKHRRLKWIQGKEIHWKSSGFKQGPNHPVVLITWDEANAFCDWLSQKTHSLIRLPSEAEWEYACRAGDMNEYPDDPDEVAWYGSNSPTYTHPVALKKTNAWGCMTCLVMCGKCAWTVSTPAMSGRPRTAAPG
jgi:formylglycine-generating enzyme required for sulfatase activity